MPALEPVRTVPLTVAGRFLRIYGGACATDAGWHSFINFVPQEEQ